MYHSGSIRTQYDSCSHGETYCCLVGEEPAQPWQCVNMCTDDIMRIAALARQMICVSHRVHISFAATLPGQDRPPKLAPQDPAHASVNLLVIHVLVNASSTPVPARNMHASMITQWPHKGGRGPPQHYFISLPFPYSGLAVS